MSIDLIPDDAASLAEYYRALEGAKADQITYKGTLYTFASLLSGQNNSIQLTRRADGYIYKMILKLRDQSIPLGNGTQLTEDKALVNKIAQLTSKGYKQLKRREAGKPTSWILSKQIVLNQGERSIVRLISAFTYAVDLHVFFHGEKTNSLDQFRLITSSEKGGFYIAVAPPSALDIPSTNYFPSIPIINISMNQGNIYLNSVRHANPMLDKIRHKVFDLFNQTLLSHLQTIDNTPESHTIEM